MFGPLPKEEVPRFLRKNQPDLMWQVCITRSRERAWLKPVCLTFCSGVWSLTRRERLAFAHTKPQLACLLSARWPPLAEEGSGFVFFPPFFISRAAPVRLSVQVFNRRLWCVCARYDPHVWSVLRLPAEWRRPLLQGRLRQGREERRRESRRVRGSLLRQTRHSEIPRRASKTQIN